MNLQIRSKDITLTDATKAHIENAVEVFRKYSLDITSVKCMITAEKKGVLVEFEIHVAHAQPIIITQEDDVLDAAIDIAVDRASKALRRLHDKVTDHHNTSIKNLETLDA
ncbi:ribosome-associated translation inhibitor RaiA [Sulfurimonas sp.]|uniref:ribosome hibernation-promoting factor, HPF/YfiA family n=1 Tax=Sulfurimonas sp. TaxID=2022749 RepID=UPI00262B466A|nr:ribosome-associated translation inhibitor RaiA [Sulfurimonas sp.]